MMNRTNVQPTTRQRRSEALTRSPGTSQRRRSSVPLATWLLAAFVLGLSTSAGAQGTDTSGAAPFHDRWLRSLMLPGVDEIPHFDGPVAEVSRTSTSDGRVTEARVWRLDERGWPIDTELTLFANNTEYTYFSTWTYGSDGLPTTIELGGGTHDVMFLSWGAGTVDVSSATFALRFTYDAARDVLEVNQTLPTEVRRVFSFRADGSYDYEFFSKDESGQMQVGATGTVDSDNLRTGSASSSLTSSLSVSERDERGNPLAAALTRSGAVTGVTDFAWGITYR